MATDRIIGTRVFGGYSITRKIGEGGMGAVYVAENHELRKKLAVKVLLPDRLSSATASSRFLAEARAASAINHKNIIEIIDSSKLPDGRHYILMEYLEGTTLRRYARGIGPMPVDVVLAIAAQVCSGLQAAHDRGIVHRDLKPSNIFLAPQPDNPYFTKVLDFGIAKLDDPNLAGDIETKSHTVAGTPNYMAPEQARALRDVDHRADVYSLGVIIYELLSGYLPFKANSIGDLTYKQASTKPAQVGELRPDLSEAWNRLVMDAIALEPSERVHSADRLAFRMIEATEHGEQIARATASMLFAPSTGSIGGSSDRQSLPPGFDEPSAVGLGGLPSRSLTASLAERANRHSIAVGSSRSPSDAHEPEKTRAARPAALGRTTNRSHRIHPSGESQRLPQERPADQLGDRGENPTTLGMSASQVSVRSPQYLPTKPTSWGKITAAAVILAGAAAILLVFLTGGGNSSESSTSERVGTSQPAPDLDTDTRGATNTTAGGAVVAPLVSTDAGVDASSAPSKPQSDKPEQSTKRGKGKRGKGKRGKGKRGKGKRGKGKDKGGDDDGDGDLFGTRK